MKKFKFLCANHTQWLSENPKAAADNWLQSYSRSLDFVQECNNRQAINHAGAAFETAEILLRRGSTVSVVDIQRFSESGLLLAQLLVDAGDTQFAHAVTASAVGRLDRLLINGIDRKTVLNACDRLLSAGQELPRLPARIHMGEHHAVQPGQIH